MSHELEMMPERTVDSDRIATESAWARALAEAALGLGDFLRSGDRTGSASGQFHLERNHDDSMTVSHGSNLNVQTYDLGGVNLSNTLTFAHNLKSDRHPYRAQVQLSNPKTGADLTTDWEGITTFIAPPIEIKDGGTSYEVTLKSLVPGLSDEPNTFTVMADLALGSGIGAASEVAGGRHHATPVAEFADISCGVGREVIGELIQYIGGALIGQKAENTTMSADVAINLEPKRILTNKVGVVVVCPPQTSDTEGYWAKFNCEVSQTNGDRRPVTDITAEYQAATYSMRGQSGHRVDYDSVEQTMKITGLRNPCTLETSNPADLLRTALRLAQPR